MQEEHLKSSINLSHGLLCLGRGKTALRGTRFLESAKQSITVIFVVCVCVLSLFNTPFTLPNLEQIIYDISLISAFIIRVVLFTCQPFELGCI